MDILHREDLIRMSPNNQLSGQSNKILKDNCMGDVK